VRVKGVRAEGRSACSEGGRVVIPAQYRRALDLKPGDQIVLLLSDGEVRLLVLREAVRQARRLVRHYIPEGRSLSEELIRDRRVEAYDA